MSAPTTAGPLAVGAGARADDPFRHVVYAPGELLPASVTADLLATFPADLLTGPRDHRSGSDKTYRVDHTQLAAHGGWSVPADTVAPVWRDLVAALLAEPYRGAVSARLEVDVTDVDVEVRISSYPAGGWMSTHTDRADKVFSQNLYLCPDWDDAWGGGLALHRSPDAAVPALVVPPRGGNSVLFARSDRSWHEVLAVDPSAPRPRRAVLVHGYRTTPAGSARGSA